MSTGRLGRATTPVRQQVLLVWVGAASVITVTLAGALAIRERLYWQTPVLHVYAVLAVVAVVVSALAVLVSRHVRAVAGRQQAERASLAAPGAAPVTEPDPAVVELAWEHLADATRDVHEAVESGDPARVGVAVDAVRGLAEQVRAAVPASDAQATALHATLDRITHVRFAGLGRLSLADQRSRVRLADQAVRSRGTEL